MNCSGLPPACVLVGVGHEPKPVAAVLRPDATSRETDRPEGVAARFHVIVNKVNPAFGYSADNLFTKDDARLALANEVEPGRP